MRQDSKRTSVSPQRHRLSVSSTAAGNESEPLYSGPLSGPLRSPGPYSGAIRSPEPYSGQNRSSGRHNWLDSHRFSDVSFSGESHGGDSYRSSVHQRDILQSPAPPPPRRWWGQLPSADGGWGRLLGVAMSPMVAPVDLRLAPSNLASEFYGASGWESPRYSAVTTPVYGGWRDIHQQADSNLGLPGREFLEQWHDREVATPRRSFAVTTPRHSIATGTPRRSNFAGGSPAPNERGRRRDPGGRSPYRSQTPTGQPRESLDKFQSPSPARKFDPEEGFVQTQDDGLKSSVWDYTLDSNEDLLPNKRGPKQEVREGKSSGAAEELEELEDVEEEKAGPPQAVGFLGLFAYADFLDKILMLVGALGAIVNGGSLPFYSLLFGNLVNTLGNNGDKNKLMAEVLKVCYYMIGLSMIVFIGSYVAKRVVGAEVTCWMLAADRQATRIRTKFLRAVLRQDVTFFDTSISTGEVMNNISADVAIIQDAIGEKVGNFIHHMATFVSGYIVGIMKSWQVSLVVFAVTPLMIICGKLQRTVYIDLATKEEEAYYEAGSLAEQALSAIRTVYSFVAEDMFTMRYSELLSDSLQYGLRVGFARGFGIGVIYLVMYGTWALALWYGSVLIKDGKITGGAAIACFFGVIVGGKGLGLAAPFLVNFAQGGVAAHRVFGIIEKVPTIDVDNSLGQIPEQVHGSIEFRKVSFTYPARTEVQIFHSFSLTVPAGKTVALVGASGSGKSTAFALLDRFYDPDKGSIHLDGIDIRQLQLRWLRKQIGLVGQEPVLYATTIKENILYGREDAQMKEIVQAAKAANADSFIQTLTDKYDTQVGERGVQLSGGQKQRVAIARAVLKDPKILLLDEATSALDTESEQIVQDALDRMMVKRTTMVIAHRLSTIRDADIIAVVSKGEVVESGRHDYLMSKRGAYFSLVNMATASMQRNVPLESPTNSVAQGRLTPMMTPLAVGTPSMIMMTPGKDMDAKKKVTFTPVENAPEKVKVSFGSLLALNKPETPLLLLGVFNAINAGIIFPFFAFIMGQVVYVYFNPDTGKMRHEVDRWAMVYVGLGFLAIIAMTGQHGFINWAGIKLTKRMREKVFEALLRQEVGWFDKDENTSGAILSRLSVDSAYVRGVLGDRISIMAMGIAAIGVGLIICAILNLKMTLVAVAVTPVFIGANFMQSILNIGVGGSEGAYSRAGTIASEAIANIRTVSSFCSEDKIVMLFNQALNAPLQESFKRAQAAGLGLGLSQALMYGGYTLTLWYGSTLVEKGETNFGVVLKIFLILILSSFSVGQIAQMAPDSSKSHAAVRSVFAILNRKPQINVHDDEAKRLDKVKGSIDFQKVYFSYPARPQIPIFQEFDLKVRAGSTMALVGASGSGKSTVVSLIQRFYDPNSGKVLLDGTDIRFLKVKWLRRQMALVGQEPVLFACTIQQNIAYGKEDASIQEIEQAARVANVHTFISSLAEGYDTQVGERGVQLSGGQKQRIAIARAVLKDPKVLLLDEATSALDTESESKVQAALEKIAQNRTTVIVAHRLSTIRNADKIAVVNNGQVVELGTHQKLMDDPAGAYFHLVTSQRNIQ